MKKISWGTGVLLSLIGFLLLNAIFIYFAFGEKVDLVTENYYEKDQKYQEEIDKQKNTNTTDHKLVLQTNETSLAFKFPENIAPSKLKGEIHLYRPSNSIYDKVFPVELNNSNEFVIPNSSLLRGYWKVKINWELDGQKFYQEEKVFIE